MVKMTLKIDGMMCGMCESHVNDKLREAFPDLKKVSASHSKGTAVIIADEEYSEEKLHAVLDPTGYKLISVESEPYQKKGFLFFSK